MLWTHIDDDGPSIQREMKTLSAWETSYATACFHEPMYFPAMSPHLY